MNVFPLLNASFTVLNAKIEKTEKVYNLACTQTHSTVMGRNSIVKETTLGIYQAGDKGAYNHQHTLHVGWDHEEKPVSEFDLWEEHPVETVGHRWGMTIDLSSCIGCGSCLVACQSENNVPVVGKHEIRVSRDMHWLRIDRYYSSDMTSAGGLMHCIANGIKVPQELALAGFSGLDLLEGLPLKGATSNAARFEMGKLAAELVIAAKNGTLAKDDRIVRIEAKIDIGDTL